MRKTAVTLTLVAACLAASARAEEEGEARAYAGAGAQMLLPQGSSRMRRVAGGAVNAGVYLSDFFAVEAEAAWLEDVCGLSVRGLGHFALIEEFDLLFGCERLDPFFTFGATGWLRRGQVGPSVGLGALYYLDDDWALRFDASAVLGLDTRREMEYSLSVGLQRSF